MVTLFPRITISPRVSPSAGTSSPLASITPISLVTTLPTPCRAFNLAFSLSDFAVHSGCQSLITDGPYVSVKPYKCVTCKFSAARRPSSAGVGGAPPVNALTEWLTFPAPDDAADSAIIVKTVGAAQRWVTLPLQIADQIAGGSIWRWQMWTAPAAVTAHVKHQPLQ